MTSFMTSSLHQTADLQQVAVDAATALLMQAWCLQEFEKPRPAYYQGNIKFSQEFEAEAARRAESASRSAQPRRELSARKRDAVQKDNSLEVIPE